MNDKRTNNIASGYKLSRRNFLQCVLATGIVSRWDDAKAIQDDSILKRSIPSTGETIPAVGLGTSDEFESAPEQSLDPLREVLRRFVDLGGTLVDTAPVYGNAESVIGQLTNELSLTKQLFLATKVRTHGKQAGIEQMERSEQLLNKKPLDLLQVHSLVDVNTQLVNLRHWKDAGRVRYIGITHSRVSGFATLERLMQNETIDFVQLNYSFTEPDAERRLLPLAADKGIAVLANRPFQNGAMFRQVKGKSLPAWATDHSGRQRRRSWI